MSLTRLHGAPLEDVSVFVVSGSLEKDALNITLTEDAVFSATVVVDLLLIATPRVTSSDEITAY